MSERALSSLHEGSPEQENVTENLTYWDVITALLKSRRLIAKITAMALVAGIVAALLKPKMYQSSASFSPAAADASSSLTGLAAQFGVDVAAPDASQSPAFYADLLKTRSILKEVVLATYPVPSTDGKRSATLLELYNLGGATPPIRLDRAERALRDATTVDLSRTTGVISFTVHDRSEQLARQIANNLLGALNHFDATARKSKARQQRQFTEARLADAQSELRSAEDRLTQFQKANRSLDGDPELRMAQDRLTREINRLQQVYGLLSESLERAKLDEIRDTPAITLIDSPESSTLPAPRRRVATVVVFTICGLLIGVFVALGRFLLARSASVEARQARALLRATRQEIASLMRFVPVARRRVVHPVREP